MSEQKTPLENLFLYIRDLFANSSDCHDFEKETGNPKSLGVNYWDINRINDMARRVGNSYPAAFQERIEKFSDVKSRVIEGELFAKHLSDPTNSIYSIANILDGWIDEKHELLKERKTVVEFQSDAIRASSFLVFERNFNAYYAQYENSLTDQ